MVGTRISRTFEADPAQLEEVRRFVVQCAAEAGLSEAATDDLVLAANEAATNAILHSGSRRVHAGWEALDDRVQMEFEDEGLFRRRVHMPPLDGSGGLGIPLMMSLTDEFELHEGTPRRPGTRIRLTKFRTVI
jgi:anti-sigma regulatory factor (Ser/Thr protein kinase)